MEGHEYTIIQQAREQNKERKRIQKEIQKLDSGEKNTNLLLGAKGRTVAQSPDDQREKQEQKAALEAKHKELMVHIPMTINTVSNSHTGSKLHGAKFQIYDQQQLYLKKKRLRIVIVILCAAINFGNQFVGNGPAPLQTEIQQHMQISDAQFNLYYSIKFLASLLPPLILAMVMDSLTLRSWLLTLSICATIGQMFFAIGLQDKDHSLCILGRLLIGLSDSLSIFQQSIMCIWFPATQLPMAFGILLFLQKIVRTTNDNVASMFYEATSGNLEDGKVAESSLVMYQWIGFTVCIISTICAFLLAQIHESVIDQGSNEVKEKKKELKDRNAKEGEAEEEEEAEDDQKQATMSQLLTKPIILFMVINAFGYASVHAFYPNMSKFFQTRFQFSNVQAGSISSLPYLVASFTVPFLGSLTSYLGETYFELMLFASIAMVLAVHICYLTISDVTEEGEVGGWITVLPLIPFGLGHALFTTMQAPTVPKLVKNKDHLSRVFTYIKITESMIITLFVFMAGYVRQITGSFTCVLLMLMCCAIISMTASFFLMQQNKISISVSMANVSDNLQIMKSYMNKFLSKIVSPNADDLEKNKLQKSKSGNDSDQSPQKLSQSKETV